MALLLALPVELGVAWVVAHTRLGDPWSCTQPVALPRREKVAPELNKALLLSTDDSVKAIVVVEQGVARAL